MRLPSLSMDQRRRVIPGETMSRTRSPNTHTWHPVGKAGPASAALSEVYHEPVDLSADSLTTAG